MNNSTALKSTPPNSMSDIDQKTYMVDQFFSNFVDFSITFIIPFICFYRIISNILNIIIFSSREFLYNYLKGHDDCTLVAIYRYFVIANRKSSQFKIFKGIVLVHLAWFCNKF